MVRRNLLGPGTEFDLIRGFLERTAEPGPEVILGPGDDCAIIQAPRTAISVDLSLEGVHFRREWLEPQEIGYRATMAALSDLAAMAARPIGVLASIAVPDQDRPDNAADIMAGVTAATESVGGSLLGGDLVRSVGGLVLDIVVLGSADGAVRRDGARPGDEIWVTGRLGGAAAAISSWLEGREPGPEAREAFARPQARTAEALWLAERGVLHAMLDISDGLAGDLRHLAVASQVPIIVEETMVPVHPAAHSTGKGIRLALGGGEDYEICFAAPEGTVDGIRTEFTDHFGTELHQVGRVLDAGSRVDGVELGSGQVAIRLADGTVEPLQESGFEHFHGS